MAKVYTLLALLVTSFIWAHPSSVIEKRLQEQEIEWNEADDLKEYQSLLESAREEGKMLFVALSDERDSAWQKMEDEDVFSNIITSTALQGYTAIEIPINSEMGSRWIQIFPATALPAFYFLGNDEFLYLVETGYLSSMEISESAKKAGEIKKAYSDLVSAYSGGSLTSVSQWKELLEVHSLNFPFEKTMRVGQDFLNRYKGDQLLQKDILPILITYGIDLQTPYPVTVIENRKLIASRMEDFSFEDYFSNVYSYNFDLAVISKDSIFLEELITEVVPHNPDSLSTTRELALETRRLYAEQTGQFSVWGKGILEYAEGIENKEEKAEAIFDVAFIIADEYNSEAALKTARKLANRAGSINPDFRYTMLESYMNYLLKNYEEAEELVRKAATQTDNPNNVRKAEGLLKMILKEKPESTQKNR